MRVAAMGERRVPRHDHASLRRSAASIAGRSRIRGVPLPSDPRPPVAGGPSTGGRDPRVLAPRGQRYARLPNALVDTPAGSSHFGATDGTWLTGTVNRALGWSAWGHSRASGPATRARGPGIHSVALRVRVGGWRVWRPRAERHPGFRRRTCRGSEWTRGRPAPPSVGGSVRVVGWPGVAARACADRGNPAHHDAAGTCPSCRGVSALPRARWRARGSGERAAWARREAAPAGGRCVRAAAPVPPPIDDGRVALPARPTSEA